MRLIRLFSTIIILFLSFSIYAGVRNSVQMAFTQRTDLVPIIDGVIEPDVWGLAEPINSFAQYVPVFQGEPSQYTEVRLLYDDEAIYVAAQLYDTHPDSILMQLGGRDASLNADAFGIRLDTYNNQLDGYSFEVYASGVQRDWRYDDNTYDGVWDSAVTINDKGWCVEMRIPYSAIRFPSSDCQTWGLQLFRSIRRRRETNQWALEEKDVSNELVHWGQLQGICNIKAPLRLSFTPYISMGSSHYPYDVNGVKNFSGTFGGGLDMKYGINESFTFDMTLMPDFSQVPSDNQVKNLSAFETVYGEQRPFFKESMDLFERGDLFYSRRIGGRPIGYGNAESDRGNDEVIIDNPRQTRLINAFKMSGRNSGGLAVGVFNAVTDKAYSSIDHIITGSTRKVQTDPTTNYNILVLDQALSNNSSAYIINTNVLRSGDFRHANVTGVGTKLVDASNSYQVRVSGALNQIYNKTGLSNNRFDIEKGSRYFASVAKIRGNFQSALSRRAINPDYNDNDMGLTHRNNEIRDRLDVEYNIYEPFWKLRNWNNRIIFQNQGRYDQYQIENLYMEYRTSASTVNYTYLSHGLYYYPKDQKDFYEPRETGRYFIRPKAIGGWAGLSSDYRKQLAVDLEVMYSHAAAFDKSNISYNFSPRLRLSDQLMLIHSLNYSLRQNDIGYAGRGDDQIIFGKREVKTIENVFSSNYIVSSDIYFSLRLRQYWSKGEYNKYYQLQANGRLSEEEVADYTASDFNFNSLNIDLVFTWLFAPGSSLNLVWKNAVLHEQTGAVANYFDNFGLLRDSPQYNSLSLKILYYLDYQILRSA
jgi:hypothetical protein